MPVDGKFPDYQRILVPAWRPQGEYPAYFDPQLLYKIHQCAKAQGMAKAGALTYGAQNCPARFHCGEVYGVVMPWRPACMPALPPEMLAPLTAPKPVAIAA